MRDTEYKSLKDIRTEKERTKRQIRYGVDRVKNDVEDCFVSPSSIFLRSSNKYMNYIGYAISAYKTAMTLKGMFAFFSRKRR